MNIFNKVIVVIILVFLVLVSLLAIVNEFMNMFEWADIASRLFNPNTDINPYISTLALLMVVTLCVFLLLLEFYRRRLKIAKIYNVESGKAMITIDTVNHQIREAVLAISGVKGMKNKIISKNKGVILNMLVELGEDVNIPEKMDEIMNKSSDVCKEKLNINVLDTKLTITNLVSEKKGKDTAEKAKVSEIKPKISDTEEEVQEASQEEKDTEKDVRVEETTTDEDEKQ